MSSNSSKRSRSDQGHGYGGYGYGGSSGYGGYGGYGYGGYGYGGYGYGYGSKRDGGLQRSLQDYLLILRERIWYIIVVFLVVFSSALVYTLSQQKIYRATATMKVFRRAPSPVAETGMSDNPVMSADDFNTILGEFQSGSMLTQVDAHLRQKPEELRQFMAPYNVAGTTLGPGDILGFNRRVQQRRGTLFIEVSYTHPDPAVSARLANLFAEEYISYRTRKNNELLGQGSAALENTVKDEREKVNKLSGELQAFLAKNGVAVEAGTADYVTQRLTAANAAELQARQQLDSVDERARQIEQQVKDGKKLTDLAVISGQSAIGTLIGSVHQANIDIGELDAKYGDLHPQMIAAKSKLQEIQSRLDIAVDSALKQFENEHANYRRTWERAKQDLDDAKRDSADLSEKRSKYLLMQREFEGAKQLLDEHLRELSKIKNAPVLDLDQVVMVDSAGAPSADDFESPKYAVNLGLGAALGLGLGFLFAFFVAYVDDRVKSSFDIESVIGLPLIGIIPAIKKMEQPDKAQVVANNADRQVSEAFLALHSALRLKDESKNAQCILTTSTIPGEGKSFVSTNLALTFAAHGERVLIIDCDLRKPNIHKSFRQENLKGVIDVIAGAATFDDVVVRQLHPNLDVMTSGGRAKNPTQILNSKKFEVMVSELRKRYDRIFFDTPPLAAVSDALIILPLMDGSLFSIFFNKVRRKAAQFAAKKLLEANVPVYGAILNGLNLAVSGYYYAQYYDKSYKDYYVVMSKGEGASPPAPAAGKPPADE